MSNELAVEDYERQYNPRLRVFNVPEIVAAWETRSEATRQRPGATLNVKVGPHQRDLVDVFRPEGPSRGAVLFYHCGNWIRFSKDSFSWVADAFVAKGYTAVIVNYPVAPANSLTEIVAATRASFAKILSDVLEENERANTVTIGHSAGGFLAAHLLATDWTNLGLPAQPMRATLSISGLYDLAPLVHIEANADMKIDADIVSALSLKPGQHLLNAPLLLAVGEDDPDGFRQQSADAAAAWTQQTGGVVQTVSGANHFTVADRLQPGGILAERVLELLARD